VARAVAGAPVAVTDLRNLMMLLGVLVCASASAADRAHSSVLIYSDTDHVQVISPTVAGSVDVGKATVSSTVSMDLISAASVDLVTAASPKGFTETRTQVDAGGRYAFGDGQNLDVGYHLSHEPDFLTHSGRLGGTRDVLSRQVSLGAAYGYSHSEIGRTHDTSFSRQRQTHDFDLSLTRVLSPLTAADLAYGVSFVDGFQANAYRYVRLYASESGTHETAVAEQTPDTRLRQTLTARLRSRLLPALFGHADYRFYADSWGMLAHTLTLRAAWRIGSDKWTLTAEARGHLQNAVSFYRSRYVTFPLAPDFRTADKELGPMWTALGGAHLEWSPEVARIDALRVSAGADVLHMRYLDYAFLTSRTALLVSIALTLEI
jgi:hypothetical protein